MNLFDMDNPVLVFLGRLVDLMILNVLTILLCIPVVTAGGAITAMHFSALMIHRDEYSGVTSMFFRSFKQNFRQGAILFGIFALFGILLGGSLLMLLMTPGPTAAAGASRAAVSYASFLGAALVMGLVLLLMIATSAFALLSRFENTVTGTLAGAVTLTFSSLPRSIAALILHLIPVAVIFFLPPLVPFAVLFLMSGPAIGTARLYDSIFKKIEERLE